MQGQSNSAQVSAGKQAFEQALIKLSGERDIAKDSTIFNEIQKYERYLIASSFVERQTSTRGTELVYVGTFDQQKMIGLLKQTSNPVWSSLRPSGILWLAEKN